MAGRRTHVPKFGQWDANDHMPFTAVFDRARAGRGRGRPINPNDPEQNPNMFGAGRGGGAPGVRPSNPNNPEDVARPQTTQQREGREGGQQQVPQKAAGGAQARKRTPGSGYPQPRGPPADRRRPSGENLLGNAKTSSANQEPHMPEFGKWDEEDLASGDRFTVIFDKKRKEKQTGAPVSMHASPDRKGDDLYDMKTPGYTQGYARSDGRKRNWFCWWPSEVKA